MSDAAIDMGAHAPATEAENPTAEEEAAWLGVVKLEVVMPHDDDAYRPQLMDATAIHSLRRELRTSEARVQRDGHLREFVPRKPAPSARPQTQPRGRRARPHGRPSASDNNDEVVDGEIQDPFVIHDGLKREYAAALHDEVEQLNELVGHYEETKRMLLGHLDLVCSTKPTERTTSHEVYEKLDELLSLAAKCKLPTAK
jgi:hypothetical protein